MKSIKYKILKMTLFTVTSSLLCCIFISFAAVKSIRNTAESANKECGDTAAESSADTLIDLNTEQAAEYVQCCSEAVRLKLEAMISALKISCGEIKNIYEEPGKYTPRIFSHPHDMPPDTLCMQWVLPEGMSMSGEREKEVYLLGNAEDNFKNTLRVCENILEIYFTSSGGVNIGFDSTPQTKPETYDGRQSDWYKYTEKTGEMYISEPYPDTFGRGLMITIALPCTGENGDFFGTVGADIFIAELEDFIADISVGKDSCALLVSEKSVICAKGLTSSDAGDFNAFSSENGSEMTELIREGKNTAAEMLIDGREVYCVCSPVGISDWNIVIVISKDEITAPSVELKKTIRLISENFAEMLESQLRNVMVLWGIVLAAVTAVTAAVTGKISDSLSGPVIRLCSASQKIGSGDLEYKCDIRTGDEIEMLSDSFSRMSASLKKYIADLAMAAEEKQRISTELDIAARIQTSVLPCAFPAYPDRKEFDIYAEMTPAREVGGDFFDYYLIDENRLGLIIADVSGKGVPAALFMMISKMLIKNFALEGLPVNKVFEKANFQLSENNDSMMFVTAFMAIIDLRTGEAEYSNAGHNPPLIYRKNGKFEFLDVKRDCVLAAVPDMKYNKQKTRFNSGDILFAYTDGVTEAVNPRKELYSEKRLLNFLNAVNDIDIIKLSEAAKKVKKDTDIFSEGEEAADDMTMLLFKYIRP